MVISAVIILILAFDVPPWYLWWAERDKTKSLLRLRETDSTSANITVKVLQARNAELEQEIIRMRKLSLTPNAEKVDNGVIKAKSAAHVRQITEGVWGKAPEEVANGEAAE